MRRAGLAAAAAIMAMGALTACGGSNDDFCKVGDDFELSSSTSPDDLQDTLDEMADKAPDEIKDDVETLRDEYQKTQDDPTSVDSEAMTKAATNVTDWGTENCE